MLQKCQKNRQVGRFEALIISNLIPKTPIFVQFCVLHEYIKSHRQKTVFSICFGIDYRLDIRVYDRMRQRQEFPTGREAIC